MASFGVSLIAGTAPPKPKPRGAPPPTYDCGKFGGLTCSQIARAAGLTKQSIRYRLMQGIRGEALLAKRADRKPLGPTTPVLGIACRLAASYPDTVPSVSQIRAIRPMSKAAAQRWQRAWAEAIEAADA